MSEEKSDFHKYCEGLDIDGFPLEETELMRKYAEAHVRGYIEIPIRETPGGGMISKRVYVPIRPLPCVRDEHGEIREQTVKVLFSKINEELDELKTEITYHGVAVIADSAADAKEKLIQPLDIKAIAEEAADTITAITTMLEALGIDAEMRDDAQRRVNQKNRKRNRL